MAPQVPEVHDVIPTDRFDWCVVSRSICNYGIIDLQNLIPAASVVAIWTEMRIPVNHPGCCFTKTLHATARDASDRPYPVPRVYCLEAKSPKNSPKTGFTKRFLVDTVHLIDNAPSTVRVHWQAIPGTNHFPWMGRPLALLLCATWNVPMDICSMSGVLVATSAVGQLCWQVRHAHVPETLASGDCEVTVHAAELKLDRVVVALCRTSPPWGHPCTHGLDFILRLPSCTSELKREQRDYQAGHHLQ